MRCLISSLERGDTECNGGTGKPRLSFMCSPTKMAHVHYRAAVLTWLKAGRRVKMHLGQSARNAQLRSRWCLECVNNKGWSPQYVFMLWKMNGGILEKSVLRVFLQDSTWLGGLPGLSVLWICSGVYLTVSKCFFNHFGCQFFLGLLFEDFDPCFILPLLFRFQWTPASNCGACVGAWNSLGQWRDVWPSPTVRMSYFIPTYRTSLD